MVANDEMLDRFDAMKPRRVLYVANSSLVGGGNKVLLDLISNLNPSRFRAHVIVPGSGPFVDELTSRGIPVQFAGHGVLASAPGKFTLLQQAIDAAVLLVRQRYDIIHANSPWVYRTFSLPAKILGVRRVCHIHFPDLTAENARWAFGIQPDAVIFCNRALGSELTPVLRGITPNASLLSIDNGIDTVKFNNKIRDLNQLKRQLGAGSRPIISLVGHISKVKGHKYFLEMAASLKNRGLDALFLMIGEDKSPSKEYEGLMRNYATELNISDRVRFLGFREDIQQILSVSDIIVQPSLEEGLPLALLEAMACGKPVITTPVGGVPLVVKSSITGILVPVGDSQALAEAAMLLMRNPEKQREIGENARKIVEQNHSIQAYARKIEDIYSELLSQ